MNNLISLPLDIPKIKPSNWDAWWSIWSKESKVIPKVVGNHNFNSALWRGFDIYVKNNVDTIECTGYNAKNINCPELFPSIFENLNKFPLEIEIVRVVSSLGKVLPHTDQTENEISVRTMLYDNNFTKTFYYEIDSQKKYQQLPEESNTWMYWDNKFKHGTDWYLGHSKHLIMYFGKTKLSTLDQYIDASLDLYKDYIIYV